MRRTLIIALGAAVALVPAAVALAAVYTAAGVSPTTATLSATAPTSIAPRTCTSADGKTAFAVTNGRYSGKAEFTAPPEAAALNGELTIRARTTIDAGTNLGYVEGSFRIKGTDSRVSGKFSGALEGNNLAGFLTGSSRGNHARVLGTLSGTWAAATGFTGSATLGGTGTIAPYAVIAGPVCKGSKSHDKSKREHKSDDKSKGEHKSHDKSKGEHKSDKAARPVYVKGTVTYPDATHVLVTPTKGDPKTCTFDSSFKGTLFQSGTQNVEMKCTPDLKLLALTIRPVYVRGTVTYPDATHIMVTPTKGDPKTCAIGSFAGTKPAADTKDVEMRCDYVGTDAALTLKSLKVGRHS